MRHGKTEMVKLIIEYLKEQVLSIHVSVFKEQLEFKTVKRLLSELPNDHHNHEHDVDEEEKSCLKSKKGCKSSKCLCTA